MLCPCKSNQSFEQCCQPIISKTALPETAEQLMRSRFCAYAINNPQYIIDTYSSATRQEQNIEDIASWAKQCQWRHLIIHRSEQTEINLNRQTAQVEFSAFFIEDNKLYILRENSHFIKEEQQWLYDRGDIINNNAFNKIKRNDPCPCQQGKKFKQCCASYTNFIN
jgi:SEC-C motif-containing protein